MLGHARRAAGGLRRIRPVPYRKPEFFQTLLVGLFICLALPPTITLERWVPQVRRRWPDVRASLALVDGADGRSCTVVLLGLCVSKLGTYSPFLYFQF